MTDINQPVSNPDLVKAIHEMKTGYPGENQARVVEEAKKARFITPVVISPPPGPSADGETVLKKNTAIRFTTIENSEEQKFIPAFTGMDELGKVVLGGDLQTLVVTFEDLCAMVLEGKAGADGFVINPFGEGVAFDRAAVMALAQEKQLTEKGAVEQMVEKDTPVRLGQPRVYPEEMVKAISEHLQSRENVKAAWLQLMEREGEQSYLIVVDFNGDKREVFDGIYRAAMDHMNGMLIDMVPFDTGFGRDAVKEVEPFYKR